MNLFPTPAWLVGCGNMTGAMVEGWRAADLDFSGVVAIRPSGTPVAGIRTVRSAAEAGAPPQLVILGFKPQQLAEVVPQLAPYLTARTVVVSLLAGADVTTLRARFAGVATIVRAMPNLPVAVRRGVVALFSEDANQATKDQVSALIGQLGVGIWTLDEARFGAVGAVAGSGPAYVARFIDALAKAGESRGLAPETAQMIALETVFGTSWLAAGTKQAPHELARRVASPKGTTEAGLAVLDREQGIEALIRETVEAAAQRGAELAREVRPA